MGFETRKFHFLGAHLGARFLTLGVLHTHVSNCCFVCRKLSVAPLLSVFNTAREFLKKRSDSSYLFHRPPRPLPPLS